VGAAVSNVSERLAGDATLREQLAAITHQLSASAVYGARDALADIFPQCARASDRRRCVEDELGALSHSAARGMMVGFIAAIRWPVLAFVFLAGVLITLLFVRAWSAVSNLKAHAPKHAS
jgi:hypothetical protein